MVLHALKAYGQAVVLVLVLTLSLMAVYALWAVLTLLPPGESRRRINFLFHRAMFLMSSRRGGHVSAERPS